MRSQRRVRGGGVCVQGRGEGGEGVVGVGGGKVVGWERVESMVFGGVGWGCWGGGCWGVEWSGVGDEVFVGRSWKGASTDRATCV